MSVLIACPKCQKKLKIEDSVLGKNIKCPGCAAVFATKAPAGGAPAAPPAKTAPAAPPRKAAPPPEEEEEEDRPAKKPAAKAARDDDEDEDDRPAKKRAAKAARDDEDDEDDRPAKKPAAKKSRADDDDEDDRPAKKAGAKKGRASDDDDDDDRPVKKEKKKGSTGKVLLIVGAIVLFLCGGCGAGAYWIYVKSVEGLHELGGKITDAASKMTAQGFHPPTSKRGPVIPGQETKKTPADTRGGKTEGPKPNQRPMYASEQQLADAMVDNSANAMKLWVPQPLQLVGKVSKVTMTPGDTVNEIFFEPQVEDLKTHQKKPFPINCRLSKPVPRSRAAVGKTVTILGHLTGGSKTSATLNDCVLVP